METHSSILAWEIPMDRGAWQATVHGVPRAKYNVATKTTATIQLKNEIKSHFIVNRETKLGKFQDVFLFPEPSFRETFVILPLDSAFLRYQGTEKRNEEKKKKKRETANPGDRGCAVQSILAHPPDR